jgi:hypothetical protein
MAYDESTVYLDPPSNEWFGFQVWPLERVAEYYYVTGDPKAEVVISGWVKWAMENTIIKKDTYEVPDHHEVERQRRCTGTALRPGPQDVGRQGRGPSTRRCR